MRHFQQIPKAELHIHLGGAYPMEYLETIATKEQIAAFKQDLVWIAQCPDYNDAFRVFQHVGNIVNTEEKVKNGVAALCRAFKKDGVTYAEIRTGLKNLGQGYEAYLQAVLDGMHSEQDDKLETKLLLSLQRSSSPEMARMTVDYALKYRDQGIVGIDVSGDSTLGNIGNIIPELLRAKLHEMFISLHIGESWKETNQLQTLVLIRPDRIGHGVCLSQEAHDWIVQHQIPVEVCLTSSVLASMVENCEDHPWLKYIAKGHPIAICTDDPLIFDTTLSKELDLLAKATGLSLEAIEKLCKNAFNYAFSSGAVMSLR